MVSRCCKHDFIYRFEFDSYVCEKCGKICAVSTFVEKDDYNDTRNNTRDEIEFKEFIDKT